MPDSISRVAELLQVLSETRVLCGRSAGLTFSSVMSLEMSCDSPRHPHSQPLQSFGGLLVVMSYLEMALGGAVVGDEGEGGVVGIGYTL